MLYPEKFVFVNVIFGTCFTRSGPPAVCVVVSCSCDNAVIEIGMFCTSPPIFDDVTVTVSREVPDAVGAEAAATCTDDELSSAACPSRTICTTPEAPRLEIKP